MANLKSAKKRIKQSAKRHLQNQARRSEIKSITKKFLEAIHENDVSKARELLKTTTSKISRAQGKGVFKKNTASRKISRLAKKLSSFTQSA